MTLIMAKFHFNLYPIALDNFKVAYDLLCDISFHFDKLPRFPKLCGENLSYKELKSVLHHLPENCTVLVKTDVVNSKSSYCIWTIPFIFNCLPVEYLINDNLIELPLCRRDIGYYDLANALFDLPYNHCFILQRYYE